MSDDSMGEADVEAIFARLRAEVRRHPGSVDDDAARVVLHSRRELDRLWAVSAERPFLRRPGKWGRVRAAILVPPKWVLRKLMRWYVEPMAVDQRSFNAAIMRTLDEQVAWTRSELDRLERLLQNRGAAAR